MKKDIYTCFWKLKQIAADVLPLFVSGALTDYQGNGDILIFRLRSLHQR